MQLFLLNVRIMDGFVDVCLMSHIPDVETRQILNLAYLEINRIPSRMSCIQDYMGSIQRVPLQVNEVGLFDSSGIRELCIKILPCQEVNKQTARPVLTEEVRGRQQFQDPYMFESVQDACVQTFHFLWPTQAAKDDIIFPFFPSFHCAASSLRLKDQKQTK